MKVKIGFVGGGKMAEGIISAIKDKKSVVVAEKVPERAAYLKKKLGVAIAKDIADVAKRSNLVFLAVRPQDVEWRNLKRTLGRDTPWCP